MRQADAPVQPATTRLCIASYNVHRCIGTDRRHDPERIATILKALDADIVGLQEVDARYHVEGGIDQAEYLARRTGRELVEGITLRRHEARYGNALLTRHPVTDVRLINLSVPGRE